MNNERTIDELIGAFNAQAQAEGRYDSRTFWEVPALPVSIHDMRETDKSKEDLAWFRARRLAKQKVRACSGLNATLETTDSNCAEQGIGEQEMDSAVGEVPKHVYPRAGE